MRHEENGDSMREREQNSRDHALVCRVFSKQYFLLPQPWNLPSASFVSEECRQGLRMRACSPRAWLPQEHGPCEIYRTKHNGQRDLETDTRWRRRKSLPPAEA